MNCKKYKKNKSNFLQCDVGWIFKADIYRSDALFIYHAHVFPVKANIFVFTFDF